MNRVKGYEPHFLDIRFAVLCQIINIADYLD